MFHCTFAIKGGRLIAIGMNDYLKIHPRKRYGQYRPKRGKTDTYKACLHSEIDCLKQLEHRTDFHKIVLFNVRINNNEEIANAEPCNNCKGVLKKYPFKKILYTIDSNNIGRWYPQI